MFEEIKGQKKAINQLQHLISKDKISGSYLFYGPSGVGKLKTAIEFAKIVNCKEETKDTPCQNCSSCHKIDDFAHPDLELIFPTPNFDITSDGGYKKDKERKKIQNYLHQLIKTPYKRYKFSKTTAIRIQTIRNIEHTLNFRPRESNYRVVVLVDADQLVVQAENAFLKTLEEPPPYALIILTTTKLDSLLPTIISRCQKLRFTKIPIPIIENQLQEKYKVDSVQARISARISNGSMAKAILISKEQKPQARKLSMDFVVGLIENNLQSSYELSEYYKSNRDEELFVGMLDFLIIWFSDIINLKNVPDLILNIDKIEQLKLFYKKFFPSNKQIKKIIELLEDYKGLVYGHVNFELIIINLFFKIRKLINS